MEKKYFQSTRYGFGMIDEKQKPITNSYLVPYANWYNKYKPCQLVLDSKELVPKENEDNDKDYQYKYTYKMVPLAGKFIKIPVDKPYIYEYELIDEYVVYYKDD